MKRTYNYITKQLTEKIPKSNWIFGGNRAKDDFYSLLERAEHGSNFPEILQIPN